MSPFPNFHATTVGILKTLSFIRRHPLTRDRQAGAIARVAAWQVRSRLRPEVEVGWIEGSKLVARKGMTGATGNIYCGLHEFADMAFLLHLLRPGDLFVDVGANIGSYTILASSVCGASTIAVEPDPVTAKRLWRNVEANGATERVTLVEAALGAEVGVVHFTVGRDTVNRVVKNGDGDTREVRLDQLDRVVGESGPVFIKLDAEGFEEQVLSGAHATLQRPSLLAIATECRHAAVLNQIREAGFEETRYEPFSRRLSTDLSLHHSNALFVRRPAEVQDRLTSARRVRVLGRAL